MSETELSDLLERLVKNEEQSIKLQQEGKDLRDRIKKIEKRQQERDNQEASNKNSTEELIRKLIGEIGDIKAANAQIVQEIKEIKGTAGQQDSQQEVIRMLSDLKGMQQRANNKRELRDFCDNTHELFTETQQKLKEPLLVQLFTTTLEGIIAEWKTRVNSPDDIGPSLDAVYTSISQDAKNFSAAFARTSFSKFSSNKEAEVTRLYNDHIGGQQYVPAKTLTQATQVTKALEKEFFHVNGGKQVTQYPQLKSQAPSMPYVYYDVDEQEVEGLSTYITQQFPSAHKLSQSTGSPCVIITFIIVHDRMDMGKWIPICEERTQKSNGKHFVILVCNKIGDAISLTTDKLPCTKLFKADFNVTYMQTGMLRRIRQEFNPKSCDAAVASIRASIFNL